MEHTITFKRFRPKALALAGALLIGVLCFEPAGAAMLGPASGSTLSALPRALAALRGLRRRANAYMITVYKSPVVGAQAQAVWNYHRPQYSADSEERKIVLSAPASMKTKPARAVSSLPAELKAPVDEEKSVSAWDEYYEGLVPMTLGSINPRDPVVPAVSDGPKPAEKTPAQFKSLPNKFKIANELGKSGGFKTFGLSR